MDKSPAARAARGRAWAFTGMAATHTVEAMVALMFMGSTLLTPLYSLYRETFQFSRIVLTLIYAAYVVGNLSALLFLGRLSDQIGRRRVTLPAITIAMVADLVYLVTPSTAWLFVGRILSGFAVGLASGAGAAWIAELDPQRDRARAALAMTGANFVGLAMGPLLAGILAQYAPWPLHLSYVVHLVALVVLVVFVSMTKETVASPVEHFANVSLRPRLGIPREIRRPFVAPLVTLFGTMALIGFYAALLPTVLAEQLHETNRAIGGLVVCWLFAVAVGAQIATRGSKSRTAMLAGLGLLIPSLALLVAAEVRGSIAILVIGTTLSGVSAAFGYRGSLQVVNTIAPADRRAEVVSTYFVGGFVGNSLPIIGVGIISTVWGTLTASAIFAATIAVLAAAAMITGAKYSR